MACFSDVLPLKVSLSVLSLSFLPLWGFHNYIRMPCVNVCDTCGHEWNCAFMKRIQTNGIACACVTFQSHSWELCSNKRFRFAEPSTNKKNKTDCDFVVNNMTIHTIMAKYSHIQELSRQPDDVLKQAKSMPLYSFRRMDSRLKRLQKRARTNSMAYLSLW